MALFDKDNPGKNLTNATIWLDSSGGSSNSGYSGDSGCGPFAAGAVVVAVILVLPLVLNLILSVVMCLTGS